MSIKPNSSRRFDVVFCDVDGCLMPEGQARADWRSLGWIAEHEARAQLKRDRPVLVPCTGRPQPYAEAVCRLIGASALPCVCENGAWLYDFGNHRWQMSPDVTDADRAAVRAMEQWVERELGPKGCYLQLGKYASVTVFHDDVAWLEQAVVPMLQALIEREGWPFRVSMTWTCINIDLKHVSKGRAIARLIDDFGLDRGRVAGIGDTFSDMLIREQVAWFGCPANADEKLKAHADVVASRDMAEGVIELLEHLSQI